MTDENLNERITNNGRLRTLKITHDDSGDDVILTVGNEELDVAGNLRVLERGVNIVCAFIKHMGNKTTLKTLDISNNVLDIDGANQIMDAISSTELISLNLSENKISDKKAFGSQVLGTVDTSNSSRYQIGQPVTELGGLTGVITDIKISIKDLKAFLASGQYDAAQLFQSASPSDEELYDFLDSNSGEDVAEMLVNRYGESPLNTVLEVSSKMPDKGMDVKEKEKEKQKKADMLVSKISDSNKLTSLDIRGNNFSTRLAGVLAQCLKQHTVLKSLCGNMGNESTLDMSQKYMSPNEVIMLAAEIEKNKELTSLDLTNVGIGITGLPLILDPVFDRKHSLESLYLGDNRIGEEDAKSIASFIKTNRTLTSLDLTNNNSRDLTNNNIGNEQAKELATILKESPTLMSLCGNKGGETELNMSGKSMNSDDAIMLAAEIEKNKALASLDLSNNNLGEDGAKYIEPVIKSMSAMALTTLNVSKNQLTVSDITALVRATTPATIIEMEDPELTEEAVREICWNPNLSDRVLKWNNTETGRSRVTAYFGHIIKPAEISSKKNRRVFTFYTNPPTDNTPYSVRYDSDDNPVTHADICIPRGGYWYGDPYDFDNLTFHIQLINGNTLKLLAKSSEHKNAWIRMLEYGLDIEYGGSTPPGFFSRVAISLKGAVNTKKAHVAPAAKRKQLRRQAEPRSLL